MSKKELKFKSPAEFFAENRQIAGFDNPGKCLFTTIREFVENGLDSAETARVLPKIEVSIEEVTKESYNKTAGFGKVSRVNHSLYSTDLAASAPAGAAAGGSASAPSSMPPGKKSSESKAGSSAAATAAAAAAGTPVSGDAALAAAAAAGASGTAPAAAPSKRQAVLYYRVTVRDNGMGMAHDDVPNMFGRVLAGTKYGVRQARGKFGLGAKMALIWSKMSTGQPLEVITAQPDSATVTFCRLDIDIHKNEPRVLAHEHRPNPERWQGAQVSVLIEGNWTTYRSHILQYMRQMAIITPYAHFDFSFRPEASPEKGFAIHYARRTDQVPEPPREVKHHPSSVNQLLFKQILHNTKQKTLVGFLEKEFSNITRAHAIKLIGELPGLEPETPLASLADKDVGRLCQLFREAKFDAPDGSCLSPIGEYNLRLGIMKVVKPDLVATYREEVGVHEGHPFLVEVGVALGGAVLKPGINIFRFANRIPLLFEKNGDVVTQTAKSINWTLYKINKKEDRIGVFCSLVSTKIPFKGTGKEYIGDDILEIKERVQRCIMKCCAQLRVKLIKNEAARERQTRKRSLMEFIPKVSKSLCDVLDVMAKRSKLVKFTPRNESERVLQRRFGLLPPVAAEAQPMVTRFAKGEISEATVQLALKRFVEQTDTEQAMEYVETVGLQAAGGRDDFFLRPFQYAGASTVSVVTPGGAWRFVV